MRKELCKKTGAVFLAIAIAMTQSVFVFADEGPALPAQEEAAALELIAEEPPAAEEPAAEEPVAEEPAAAETEETAEDAAAEAVPEAEETVSEAAEQTAVQAQAAEPEETAEVPVAEKAAEPGKTQLTITNNTGMFKAVSAYLIEENGQEYLVMALNGTGYRELCKGTYEQAIAGGDGSANGNNTWVHGKLNEAGKLEFKIPLSSGESYVPCVAVSNSYYEDYLNGRNALERAFYPRQFAIDREAKTLTTGDYDETSVFTVTSNVADFKVEASAVTRVVGGPNSNNYNVAPALEMKDGTYTSVEYPTVKGGKVDWGKAALSDGKFVISLLNAPNVEAFKDKEPLDMWFTVAEDAPYEEAGEEVLRKVTIDKMAKTIVITGDPLTEKGSGQTDPEDPSQPDKPDTPSKPDKPAKPSKPDTPSKPDKPSDKTYPDKASSSTSAVDASTTLKDGEYTPDSFSWSGGTGRVSLSCTKITVRGGKAYATIVFTSSQFDQLKASGSVYYKQGSGNSTFVIPVNLNANNTIIGRTTAMSQPHWIEYTIYIGKAESAEDAAKAKEARKEAAEAKLKISDKAPTITGLKAAEGEAESDTEYATYFKIFNYEQGVKLLSIDISQDTALKEEYTKNAEKAMEDSDKEDTVEYDDDGNIVTRTKIEYTQDLYKNNVVNYLLVPEDFEVPAGLEKEYIIVNVPAQKTFMASPEGIALMEQLDCLDAVSLLGIEEKDIDSDTLQKAVKDDKVKLAGNTEKPDYQKMIKDKSDLVILPGDVLPEEVRKDAKDKEKLTEEAKKDQEHLEKLESRFATLDVPAIIDRSAQEKDELAQAEWIKVYGALYGCEEEADKIFDAKVKEAKAKGTTKKEAKH